MKIDKLPPIFPIMVYSGQPLWAALTDMAELIEHPDLFGKFTLNFRCFKIAENEISVQRLFEIRKYYSKV